MKTIYAIQHLAFEDLGSFEDIFYQHGFRVRYFDAGVDDLQVALEHPGLTVILGGPISAYERERFPFLGQEIDLLKERVAKNLPTLGICLGAQLIAKALGADIYPGHIKEIGWSQLKLNPIADNLLAPLEGIKVLHWHGDSFDIPDNAQLLAGSEHYPHQAFQLGINILALQFHLEVMDEDLEKWLIGHCVELDQAKINIKQLREDNQKYAAQLEQSAAIILNNYLRQLNLSN
jgi:GMP synthase (glutamine-hydrolysing)